MPYAAGGKMRLNTFEDLFVHKLKTLYSAETQFAEAQPKLAEAVSDEELRAVLERHVEVTLTTARATGPNCDNSWR